MRRARGAPAADPGCVFGNLTGHSLWTDPRPDRSARRTSMRWRWIETVAVGMALALTTPSPARAADDVRQLRSAIQALQSQVAALQSQLEAIQKNSVLGMGPYISVAKEPINGVSGPHIIFTGANIHVR